VLSNWETRWVECWGVLTNESLQYAHKLPSHWCRLQSGLFANEVGTTARADWLAKKHKISAAYRCLPYG
jgi:hypothetical protein